MSDESIQDLIYKPISENLDIVIREIINESEHISTKCIKCKQADLED